MNWKYLYYDFEPEQPIKYYGFIYKITYSDDTYYYGKKAFWEEKTLPPLKGNRAKRRVIKESKWKTYAGSSKNISELTIATKEIIEFANSKAHLTYLETQLLMNKGVLFDDKCHNENIGGKFFDNIAEKRGEWFKEYTKRINSEC